MKEYLFVVWNSSFLTGTWPIYWRIGTSFNIICWSNSPSWLWPSW